MGVFRGNVLYMYVYFGNIHTCTTIPSSKHHGIGSVLNPLAGTFTEDTRKKGKGEKTGASHDWRGFYLSQYDWLKCSHMTKVVWLPNEIDYSYCEFVAPNTLYCTLSIWAVKFCGQFLCIT